MLMIHYFESLLFIYSHWSSKSDVRADFLPVFKILLKKLGVCDIQVVHNVPKHSVDWFNIQLPVKMLTNLELDTEKRRPYRINMWKARVATNYKFVILISNNSLELGSRFGLGTNLDEWVETTTYWHLYDIYWRYFRVKDAILTVVTTNLEGDGRTKVFIWTGKYFKISMLFTAFGDQVKICAWFKNWLNRNILRSQQTRCDIGLTTNDSILDITEEFVPQSPKWCYHRQFTTHKSFLKFDICQNKHRNPFDHSVYKSHIENIFEIIFIAANETLVENSYCKGYSAYLYDEAEPLNNFDTKSIITLPKLCFEFISCYRDEYITFKYIHYTITLHHLSHCCGSYF